MKRKYAAITLRFLLGITHISGCASIDTQDTQVTSENKSEENTIYGEVKTVTSTSITIEVGTRKEIEQPSMLDLTGEEQEIQITDDTVIQHQSAGGPGNSPDGEALKKSREIQTSRMKAQKIHREIQPSRTKIQNPPPPRILTSQSSLPSQNRLRECPK